jgi:hypothetical protein
MGPGSYVRQLTLSPACYHVEQMRAALTMLPEPCIQRCLFAFAFRPKFALDCLDRQIGQHERSPLTPVEQLDDVLDGFLIGLDTIIARGGEVACRDFQGLINR